MPATRAPQSNNYPLYVPPLASQFEDYLLDCRKVVSTAINSTDAAQLEDALDRLKDVQFKGRVPDYTNPITASYYQLRYACGYAFEYYCMYRLLLGWMQQSGCNRLSIASLGCGVGLDYYALNRALEDSGADDWMKPINQDESFWHGVDLQGSGEWGGPSEYKGAGRPFPDDGLISRYPDGAAGYFAAHADDAVPCPNNVFFFPRMLSEICDDRGKVTQLVESIQNASIKAWEEGEPFWVCIANRSDHGPEIGVGQEVVDAFRRTRCCCHCGAECEQYPVQFAHNHLKLGGAWDLCSNPNDSSLLRICEPGNYEASLSIRTLLPEGFTLPNAKGRNILQFMFVPEQKCKEHYGAKGCAQCKKDLGVAECLLKSPVSKTSQMQFQIFKLS